jgi:hypothetical protein
MLTSTRDTTELCTYKVRIGESFRDNHSLHISVQSLLDDVPSVSSTYD